MSRARLLQEIEAKITELSKRKNTLATELKTLVHRTPADELSHTGGCGELEDQERDILHLNGLYKRLKNARSIDAAIGATSDWFTFQRKTTLENQWVQDLPDPPKRKRGAPTKAVDPADARAIFELFLSEALRPAKDGKEPGLPKKATIEAKAADHLEVGISTFRKALIKCPRKLTASEEAKIQFKDG